MKLTSILLVAVVAGCSSTAFDESESSTHAAQITQKVALIPMHMQFKEDGTDWLMSRTAGEGAPAYHYNGIAYRVFEAPPKRPSREIYRCVGENGIHYQSPRFDCEGVGKEESLLGYALIDDPADGAQPIIRCIGEHGYPIITTIRPADCEPFILQGLTLGYGYSASVSGDDQ